MFPPESAVGESPFGVVENGDLITCDIESRRLQLEISDEELQARINRRKGRLPERPPKRGYLGLYERSVNQAPDGADFDFLTARGH